MNEQIKRDLGILLRYYVSRNVDGRWHNAPADPWFEGGQVIAYIKPGERGLTTPEGLVEKNDVIEIRRHWNFKPEGKVTEAILRPCSRIEFHKDYPLNEPVGSIFVKMEEGAGFAQLEWQYHPMLYHWALVQQGICANSHGNSGAWAWIPGKSNALFRAQALDTWYASFIVKIVEGHVPSVRPRAVYEERTVIVKDRLRGKEALDKIRESNDGSRKRQD